MNRFRQTLRTNALIKRLSSIKLTVLCLGLLFFLTFAGTIDQVFNGLYHSQRHFFDSFVFLWFGFLPLPGARLVLWLLFINLACVAATRFVFRRSHIGILIIHLGILLYFVTAFVTFHDVQSSHVTLAEGQATNVSKAYHRWEVSLWPKGKGPARDVEAFDTDGLRPGRRIALGEHGIKVTVKTYDTNSDAYISDKSGVSTGVINGSGITSIKKKKAEIRPEKNVPGGIFLFSAPGQKPLTVLLYGGETKPTRLTLGGRIYFAQLRHRRYPLPFLLKLLDFQMKVHPDTEIAKSYQSLVEIQNHNVSRNVLISMNRPMRYKNYTFYQASYSVDQFQRHFSTLAVVRNSGRFLPYIACFVTFAGLVIHFSMMAFDRKRKPVRKEVAG